MIRITGGQFKGRVIEFPPQIRPTQSRLRQAWLNSLQFFLKGARVLDLFAGSGALGIEAVSRGAEWVVWVEKNKINAHLIQKNLLNLGIQNQGKVLIQSVNQVKDQYLKKDPFHLVFADPPYLKGWEEILLRWPWENLLAVQGLFCLEWRMQKKLKTLPQQVSFLKKIREKRYGNNILTTYIRMSAF